LRRLTAPALAAARSLRREQEFTGHAGHALDYALDVAGTAPGGSLLVLGGGVMARRVIDRALELGFDVTVAARRPLPPATKAAYVPLSEAASLPSFDFVAGCLGSGAPVMAAAVLPPITSLAMDFGTPRNFAGDLDVPLVTIADLLAYQSRSEAETERRAALRSRLEDVLRERLAMESADGASPLGSLRGEVETIRRRELARAARLHPELPLSTLDTITRSLVNQIFHQPSLRLRATENHTLAAAFADLFRAPASLNPLEVEAAHDGE
jgi:glutamyl-tRNA reductase